VHVFLTALLTVASASPSEPPISLFEAVEKAKVYLSERGVQNERRYLASAKWHHSHEEPNAGCWYLAWDVYAWPPVTDSHLHATVCSNGDIRYMDNWD
jgi:hypothetical protein